MKRDIAGPMTGLPTRRWRPSPPIRQKCSTLIKKQLIASVEIDLTDLFTHRAAVMVAANADHFTAEFVAYLPANLHVYDAFEREALQVVARGYQHYSARTIIEVLRHHSALHDTGSEHWKLNDWHTPYFARAFALVNPANEDLFEFRKAKAARRMPGSVS